MVLKQCTIQFIHNIVFENDVKTYGTQAAISELNTNMQFENDVKTYGTQASHPIFR